MMEEIDHQQKQTFRNHIIQGDARTITASLPAESIDCVITSPPYSYKKRGMGFT